jgi:hypothetical protein
MASEVRLRWSKMDSLQDATGGSASHSGQQLYRPASEAVKAAAATMQKAAMDLDFVEFAGRSRTRNTLTIPKHSRSVPVPNRAHLFTFTVSSQSKNQVFNTSSIRNSHGIPGMLHPTM